jgi:hypothetical protein
LKVEVVPFTEIEDDQGRICGVLAVIGPQNGRGQGFSNLRSLDVSSQCFGCRIIRGGFEYCSPMNV